LLRHFFWNSASLTAKTSSTIKIWFALLPVRKALRACLRQPISARPAPRFGLQMRCDREPHIHPGAIPLYRRVDITRTARKLDNLIELPRELVCSPPNSQSPSGLPAAAVLLAAPALRFSLPHPQNRPVQENILICASPRALHPLGQPSVARPTGFPDLRFTTRQFRMETRADLQQRSIAAQCRKEWRVTGGELRVGLAADWFSLVTSNSLLPTARAAGLVLSFTSPILRYGSSFPRTLCHQRFTSCANGPVPTSPRR
jgi:hypothetical protein